MITLQDVPEELTVTIKTMGDSGTGETFLLSLNRLETALMVKHLSRLPGLTSQQRTTLLNYLMRRWGRTLAAGIPAEHRTAGTLPIRGSAATSRR